jgi:hypothetical protein
MAEQLIHFGKLCLLYDNGFVRYIRTGEIEIVRNIYFALRDNNWTTAPFERTDERILVTPKNFEISYTAINVVEGKEVFRWHVKINGNDLGDVEFAIDGDCLLPYNRNRAGICVLHPIRDTRGKEVYITRPDGSMYKSSFPTTINPHQPFFDIQKMSWPILGDTWAELQFEGDTFETEDQRNWSDTSFKTYSTPISVPYPVMLKPGDKVSQRVKLKLTNGDSLPVPDLAEDIEVTIDESSSKAFPKIGTEFPFDDKASQKTLDLLKELQFDHLRIELELDLPGWKEKLEAGLQEAEVIGAKPFIHLVMSSPGQWSDFASMNISSNTKLAVSPVDKKSDVNKLLKAGIGAGFTSYFTELNRNRFNYTELDFVIYPVTPQAHLSDLHTVIENLAAQKDQVETAKTFVDGNKIHVGPVYFNRLDPIQSTALAAGWMFGSIKYLSEGGADYVTMFESHGRAGYVENDVYPVYNALLSLLKLKPNKIVASTCNEPLVVTSLVIESEDKQRHLILINHTASKKSVSLKEQIYKLSDHEIKFISLR